MCRFLCSLLLVFVLALCPPGRAADDASARAVLRAAVDALGGAEHFATLDQWFVEGKGRENLTGELQGLAPDAPTWRNHEERIAVSRSSGSVAWERRTPRNDFSLRWRRFIYKPDAFGVVDWTSGEGGFRGRTIPENERLALMHRIPHLLVLDAAAHAKQVHLLTERRRNGVLYDRVEAVMADEAHLTLFFTRSPTTLARVEYSLYLPGYGETVVGWQWHGWKKDPSLGFVPGGHAIDVGGTPFQEVEYSRYRAGDPDADRLLSIPADLGPASRAHQDPPPSPAGPANGEVALGVHIAGIRGFQAMFIEFRDFVVAFDAPAAAPGLEAIPAADQDDNDSVSAEFAALIARTCPSKPVRYIVVSHHHSDHLGGLKGLGKDGVTVFAAPTNINAVAQSFHPSLRAAKKRSDGPREVHSTIEPVARRKTISDGLRQIEIINVGANPHTSANLFIWLPKEKLVLQGDLFYYREGDRFPPPGRETMNRFFSRWLADHHMEPKAIYGVHGAGAAGPEALARAARMGAPPKP